MVQFPGFFIYFTTSLIPFENVAFEQYNLSDQITGYVQTSICLQQMESPKRPIVLITGCVSSISTSKVSIAESKAVVVADPEGTE